MSTEAATMLVEVRTAIRNLISSGEAMQSFSIGGVREARFYSLDELMRLEANLVKRASRESGATGGGSGGGRRNQAGLR